MKTTSASSDLEGSAASLSPKSTSAFLLLAIKRGCFLAFESDAVSANETCFPADGRLLQDVFGKSQAVELPLA